jgi:hypothetical protein
LDFTQDIAFRTGTQSPIAGVSGWTYTRSGSAYDLAGSTLFSANTPRRTSAGLLVEAGATNLALWSQDFSNAAWTKTNVNVTTGVGAPDGTTNAHTLSPTVTDGQMIQTIGGSLGVGQPYTSSMWVRRRSGSGNVWLINPDGAGITLISPTSAWQRFSVTGNGAAVNNLPGIRINTIGDQIDVFGAQLETGSTATSYIPTTTSSASRGADAASVTGLSFSGAHSVIALTGGQNPPNPGFISQLDDTTVNNRSAITYQGANLIGVIRSGGSASDPTMGTATTAAQRTAIRVQTSNSVGAVNGVLGGGVGTLQPTGTLTRLGIGQRTTTADSYLNGLIQLLAIVPRALTDAELTGATS